jgi:ubiquinone/menaquinone biosynthesis C-methylase UbiE
MTSNDQKYNSKNPVQRFFIQRFLEKISHLVSKVDGINLLDVGSGEGHVLGKVLEKQKFQTTALDPNENALIVLKKKLPEVETKNGYIEKLPFTEDSFDVIMCCEVLEHLEDPERALSELKRVGRKHFILSVPNEPWFSWANFIRGRHVKKLGCHPEHIQKWSRKEFSEFVSRKLKIIEINQSFPWTIVLAKK